MMTMREVPAMRKIEPEYRVSRLQNGRVGRNVGLRPRMWLDVRVLGAEDSRSPVDGQLLRDLEGQRPFPALWSQPPDSIRRSRHLD